MNIFDQKWSFFNPKNDRVLEGIPAPWSKMINFLTIVRNQNLWTTELKLSASLIIWDFVWNHDLVDEKFACTAELIIFVDF